MKTVRYKHSASCTLTEEQYAQLTAAALSEGMKTSEYMRHRLFDERVTTDAKPPRRTHTPLAYFVYVVKNDIDNSVYFGRTGNWQSRWLSHLSCAADHRSNHPLYVAMRKLGVDHFTLSVLHVTMDIQESKDLEAKYINAARDRGMNVYNCGECANFGVVRHMVAIAKKRLAKEWGLIP